MANHPNRLPFAARQERLAPGIDLPGWTSEPTVAGLGAGRFYKRHDGSTVHYHQTGAYLEDGEWIASVRDASRFGVTALKPHFAKPRDAMEHLDREYP